MRGNPRNKVRGDLMSRGWSVIEGYAEDILVAVRGREVREVHINAPGCFTAAVTEDGVSYNFDPGPPIEKHAGWSTV